MTHFVTRLTLCAGNLALGLPLCAAAWVSVGPFGGSAAVVVVDPYSSRTVLAATRNALLFRSEDGGDSWAPIAFPAQFHATLNALVADPKNSGVYFAGLSSELPQYSGILRSADRGATWRQVPGMRGEQVRAIAVRPLDSRTLAAGTDTGVFVSRDGGTKWTRVTPLENDQLRPVVSIAFDPKDEMTLYVGTPHLPWKTSDGGLSWQSIHTGMLEDSDVFSIQVDRNRPKRIFASACSGIYRSLNGAETWTKLTEVKETSSRTYVIAQDIQYENIWYAGTTHGFIRSLDGGATWVKLGAFATRSIAFDYVHLGRIFITTDENGIMRSEDSGQTWHSINSGFCNRRLSPLWTSNQRVYTTALDGGKSGRVLELSEDREWWSEVARTTGTASLPVSLVSSPWSARMVFGKFAAGLFVSRDTGRNWTTLDLPVMPEGIRAFTVLDGQWIAAIGPGGIFLSRDGRNWIAGSLAAGDVYGIVTTLSGRLLAATASGLKSSDDFGLSWKPVRGELESDTVQAICRWSPEGAIIFAAKYGIVYASADGGRTWVRISPENWPVSSVQQLIVMPGTPSRLLALTHQQGVWELPLENLPRSLVAAR